MTPAHAAQIAVVPCVPAVRLTLAASPRVLFASLPQELRLVIDAASDGLKGAILDLGLPFAPSALTVSLPCAACQIQPPRVRLKPPAPCSQGGILVSNNPNPFFRQASVVVYTQESAEVTRIEHEGVAEIVDVSQASELSTSSLGGRGAERLGVILPDAAPGSFVVVSVPVQCPPGDTVAHPSITYTKQTYSEPLTGQLWFFWGGGDAVGCFFIYFYFYFYFLDFRITRATISR